MSLLLALQGAAPADPGLPWAFAQPEEDAPLQDDDGLIVTYLEDDALFVAALPLEEVEPEPDPDWQQAPLEDDALWIACLPEEEVELEPSEDWQQPYLEDDPPLVALYPDEHGDPEDDEAPFALDLAWLEAITPVEDLVFGAVDILEEEEPQDEAAIEPWGDYYEVTVMGEWIVRARRRGRR